MTDSRLPTGVALITLILLAGVPLSLYYAGHIFWLDIFTRAVVLAIAAASLNLMLGFAGLASFGHAAYLGIGAYAVGVPAYYETYGGGGMIASYSGWWHLGLALGASALFAVVTGAISLRTRGIHFIMITMAFGQMLFYLLVSIDEYGADDGMTVDLTSQFSHVDLSDPVMLFGICYGSLLLLLLLQYRLKHSHFGRILAAIKQNENRTRALGVNTFYYKLTAYVLAGVICAYAGVLMANFSTFISPGMIEWTRSGELMFMVILGGTAWVFGPVVGAMIFVLLEYFLAGLTVYWHLPFGLLLILTVLLFRGGLGGMLQRIGATRGEGQS